MNGDMDESKDMKLTQDLRQAVADIKSAILQGQYEACKGVNRIQLAVYFGIGKYISRHTRKGTWGTGALEVISGQLRRELPGLRGYSATALKNMRKFYENWEMLDANSTIAIAELQSTEYQRDAKSWLNAITLFIEQWKKTSHLTNCLSLSKIIRMTANSRCPAISVEPYLTRR